MSDLTITHDVIANWLPRRFMMSSAESDRERFEKAFGSTLFLLVKLRSYSDPLALGLEATCPVEINSPSTDLAGLLGASGATAEATGLSSANTFSSQAIEDWIATPIAHEPRFVVPIRKRLMNGARKVTVGRSYDCDIVLREQSVSKTHAHFELTSEGNYVLVDNNSKNRTRVNGTVITSPTIVRPGNVVQFGRIEAKVCSPAALWSRLASA